MSLCRCVGVLLCRNLCFSMFIEPSVTVVVLYQKERDKFTAKLLSVVSLVSNSMPLCLFFFRARVLLIFYIHRWAVQYGGRQRAGSGRYALSFVRRVAVFVI